MLGSWYCDWCLTVAGFVNVDFFGGDSWCMKAGAVTVVSCVVAGALRKLVLGPVFADMVRKNFVVNRGLWIEDCWCALTSISLFTD